MSDLIYMARPIDLVGAGAGGAWAQGVYTGAITTLGERGFVTYDPSVAFKVGVGVEGTESWLQEINRAAMYRARGMMAVLPDGVPTIGTPMEIFEAARVGKAVAVLTDIEGSWSLAGLGRRNVALFPLTGLGVRDAVAWLENQLLDPDRGSARVRRDVIDVVLGEGGVLPTRGYTGDAGFDLHVVGDHWVQSGTFIDIPCYLKLGLPGNMWGLITGRSSTLRRRGLMVSQGVIDSGYRGDIYTGVWNLGADDVLVGDGDRLAQLIPFYNTANSVDMVEVDKLDDTDRGDRGFGSTGA